MRSRYCSGCGSPMRRLLAQRDGWRYDERTGSPPAPEWWWACSGVRGGSQDVLLHARPRRIRESRARFRLRDRAAVIAAIEGKTT